MQTLYPRRRVAVKLLALLALLPGCAVSHIPTLDVRISSVKCVTGLTSHPVLTFDVVNKSGYAIQSIDLLVVAGIPGRSVPAAEYSSWVELSNGIEPGETRSAKLICESTAMFLALGNNKHGVILSLPSGTYRHAGDARLFVVDGAIAPAKIVRR